jgi:hypothetical protein
VEINFKWLRNRGGMDYDKMRAYCDSEKAVAFCWWVRGDLDEPDDELYGELCELIALAKVGKSGQWRGNAYWLSFSQDGVSMLHPFDNEEFTYDFAEFETALNGWANEITKMRAETPL